MKHFNNIAKNKDFWQVDIHRTKIKPFPGRYPTRWRILFTDVNQKILFDRITKPNSLIINGIIKKATHTNGYLTLFEFDRGGAFRHSWKPLPRVSGFGIGWHSPAIIYCYYPWHTSLTDFFGPWLVPTFSKQMKLGKKTFFVYSPYGRMWFNEGTDESTVAGVPPVVAKNKSVEVIDLGKLPRIQAPARIQMQCMACGNHFSKLEKYKGLIVRCDSCGYGVRCQ
jgi:hypothetical protein